MENKEQNGQLSVEEMLAKAAEEVETQDEEEQKEHLVQIGKRLHESHTDRRTVRSILKKYQEKKIILPLCQRLYLWNDKLRSELLDSIERGMLCGSIELATREGTDDTQYLCDGLQRITSMMLLSNDITLTEAQRKAVLDYQLTMEVVYDLNDEEMALWFLRLNSGITVAQATKARATLPESIRNEVIKISGCDFFRTIAEKANTTFAKNSHADIIAENILFAVSDMKAESMKAKDICKRLTEHEADIIGNYEKAEQLTSRLASIYEQFPDEQVKRSMNANFVGVLVHVMAEHNEFTDSQYTDMINYVFANNRAVKEYSATTGSGSGDAEKVGKRYNVIVDIISQSNKAEIKTDTVNDNVIQFDNAAYHIFCKDHNGKVINTRSNDYPVDFSDITENERKQLYTFYEIEQNVNKYEGMIIKVYNRVEKEA